MSDKFQSVQPGQKIRIDAGAMNAMLEAARAHEQSKFNKQVPGSNDPNPGRVRIKNDSGEDLDRFAVVELTGPLIAPDDNLTEFQRHIGFVGEIPSEEGGGRFAILAEPIPDGRIGKAWASGVCPVQIDVLDASHRFADTEADTHEHLVSTATAAAEILWAESGTGLKWALVRLGADLQSGYLLKTTSTISARSGTTLGSGSCIICTRSGATIVETATTITVYNSQNGDAIPAGKYVQAKLWRGVPLIDVVECD